MKDKQMAKYLVIKQEILRWLKSGRLKANDLMPSENEIAEQFHVSRQTVRQSLGELEQEGWLYRQQGKGTFVSNPSAQKGHGVQTIGVITTNISNYIFPLIVRGAEAVLRSKGYRLVLSSTDNNKEKERENLSSMMSQPLSGLIIEPTKSAEGNPNLNYFISLDYQQIPYIMINERYSEMNCPYIKMDDEEGGFLAAQHLIELGHRRIAGFFKTDDLQGVNRLKGFIRAHHQYEVPLLPDLVIHYSTEEKQTKPYDSAIALLGSPHVRPSAFVCYNDELALHLLGAIRHCGMSVPLDISLVGFDDSNLATATEVKLTTLSHPKSQLGTEAAELLISMIEGKHRLDQQNPIVKIHKPELIIRESTRLI
ncbi:MAG TPA: GntR family transcriptional regulator [Bacilli bacterium]